MTRDQFVAAHAIVAYQYNTSGVQFAQDIFPGTHPSYQLEKAESWAFSSSRAIGLLDSEHFARLVAIALERHGEGARQYAALAGVQ